jgi:hypothetical protein
MSIPTGIRRDKNITASALFGVAAIQVIVGAIGWFLYGGELGLLDWIITFSGGIYIALGIAARWLRLPAAIIGAVLYLAFLGLQASQGMELLMAGLIFKVPVVVLLLVAVGSAFRRQPARHAVAAPEERVSL